MSRLYFNESPQVTALKEAHEKELKNYKKAIITIDITYRKLLKEFNSLPWWKKMFYKFKI